MRPMSLRFTFRALRRSTNSPRTTLQFYSSRSTQRSDEPTAGTTTPISDEKHPIISKSAYKFEAGYALFAKRPSRPFPPPFLSAPSGSFSDALSTHDKSRDRRPKVNGEMIRGVTNGDDAVLVSDNLICANDGVGAWAHKERGHAALWSRLILHYLALEAEKDSYGAASEPDPKRYLQNAYDRTLEATKTPNEWFGTTTACSALLHTDTQSPHQPIVYVTQLGDSQILVIRPRDREILFKTEEQWHWFDCPLQLGTNSLDQPEKNAVVDKVTIEEDDMVLALSDGVSDNLWDHEVVTNVCDSLETWKNGDMSKVMEDDERSTYAYGMQYVAEELVKAARKIAEDPFAESPYMERGVEEGLPMEGGKLDDISVVAAICKRRSGR